MREERKMRARKTRMKLSRSRPRLTVFRSSRNIYAQIIDDSKGQTIASVSSVALSKEAGHTKKDAAKILGGLLAERALERKIKKVVFDRGPYKFHGRVRELAKGAKEGGLEF